MKTPKFNQTPSSASAPPPCSPLLDPSDAPKDGTVILGHFGWPHFVPAFWCRHLEEWVTAQPEGCAPGEMQLFESDTEIHARLRGWIPMPNIPSENTPSHTIQDVDAIHSCSHKCNRPICIARRERDEMKAWIMKAAPLLSAAACIVIDESIERLGEIEGVRGVLELCPVNYLENDPAQGLRVQ